MTEDTIDDVCRITTETGRSRFAVRKLDSGLRVLVPMEDEDDVVVPALVGMPGGNGVET